MTIQDSNREIITLLAEGKTAKEIGAALNMPTRTVEDRILSMRKEYQASNRVELVTKYNKCHERV